LLIKKRVALSAQLRKICAIFAEFSCASFGALKHKDFSREYICENKAKEKQHKNFARKYPQKMRKKWAHNFRTKICANFPKNNKCKISAQKYAQDLVHANVRIFRANIHVQILRKKMSAKFAHIFVRKFCTHFASNFLRILFCVVFTKTCAYFSASLLQ
jgi:hypothetical protein